MVPKTITILFVLEIFMMTLAFNSPPAFVKQPPGNEVHFQVGRDRPLFIECEATGEPAPTYYWTKNGKRIQWPVDDRFAQREGKGTVRIDTPRDEDIGQYQCFAENEFGTAASNSVYLRKLELNYSKIADPASVKGNEGSPFKLSCREFDASPKPNFFWIRKREYVYSAINNSRLTVDPEGSLWFSNLTMEDTSSDFVYTCAASSPIIYEYKLGNQIHLDVVKTTSVSPSHIPVRQYVSKKNIVAMRGKTVQLFCIYGGTPLPLFTWLKDEQYINRTNRITYTNFGKTLVINSVDFGDEGTYTCKVSNGVGTEQSYSMNLKVLAVPFFTEEPEIIIAAEDETIEIKCVASGVPKPTIEWIHNGLPIEFAPPNQRRTVTSKSIVIKNTFKNDTGNYGCNATNSLGYVYKDVYLNVLALQPQIIEAPSDQMAINGQNINVTCKVFGVPKPIVKWLHHGLELTGKRHAVLDNGDLQIMDVTLNDTGVYTCFAENKFGSVATNITFSVKVRTFISEPPRDYETPANLPVTFRCSTIADPSLKVTISWYYEGKPINFQEYSGFTKSDDSMIIEQTELFQSGKYTCTASTELDSVSADAYLIVQDVPNAPRIDFIKCHQKEAELSWKSYGDNRSPILRYQIQSNNNFNADHWELIETVPVTVTTFKVPINSWGKHSFRVVASNKIGSSPPSSPSGECSGPVDVPHKNPDNVKGEGNFSNNLVIKWTKMPESEHNAPNFGYRVYWKRDMSGESFSSKEVKDWRQEELVIPDQPSFTQYLIKIVSQNELGEANVAPEEVVGYSGEDKPLKAPTDFTVEVNSATDALLRWKSVPLESIRGHFKGYKIKTWAENRSGYREMKIQPNVEKALIVYLTPNNKNFAQIYVYNGKYNGPPSEVLSFHTPEGRPGQISFFETSPLGPTGFSLIWHKPDTTNGVLLGYKIFYAAYLGNRNISSEYLLDIKNPDQLQANITGLMPNTQYRIYIASYTKAGDAYRYFLERVTRPSA